MRRFNLGHSEVLSWPMTQAQLDGLGQTLLVSPRVGNAHGYSPMSEATFIYQVEQLPQLREEVEAGVWSDWWWEEHHGSAELSPILQKYLKLSTRRPGKCADTVRMDHPFDIWDIVIAPYAMDEGIEPATPNAHEGIDFVESVIRRSSAHAMIATGLDKAFDVKYAFGQCRPVEYYDCGLQRYGTPTHGESPAGHGAFSGAGSKAFETLYNATPQQIADVQYATKQFAQFRSLSAMHVPFSNMLGWTIGYEA